MIQNHHRALSRLESALGRPLAAPACFPALYQRDIGDGEWMLALAEALAHLNHLHQTGRATRSEGADGSWRWQSVSA
jgi:hypothetical protein